MVSTHDTSVKFFSYIFLSLIFVFIFPEKVQAQVKLNEVMIDSNTEWVEFYNSSASADFLKDYFIDDDIDFNIDSESSAKHQLLNINTSNPTYPYIDGLNTFFNNDRDKVVLFDSNGQIVDQYEYVQNPGKERALGKKPDGNGSFYKMTSETKGYANSDIYLEPSPSPSATPSISPSPPLSPSPSLSPSPIPSISPSPLPSKSPSPKPTKTPTPSFGPEENVVRGETLGIGTTTASSSPEAEMQSDRQFPLFAVSLIAGGLSLVGLASFLFFRSYQKDQKQNVEELL